MPGSVTVVMLTAVALVACGKKEGPPGGSPGAPPAATSPSAAPAPQPGEPAPQPGEPAPRPEPVAADPGQPGEPSDPEAPSPAEPGADPTDPADHEAADLPTQPAEPGEPSDEPAPEAAAGGSDACATIVPKQYALIRESGTEEMRAAIAETPEAESVTRCRAAPPSERVASCIAAATTALEVFRTCYPLAFEGRDLTVGRTFDGRADNAAAEPPVFSQDGDAMTFGNGCQILHQKVGLISGFFISCNAKTVGPITTGDDVRAAIGALMEESAAGHRAVMGIMANYPAGGTARWKVCDSSGNCRFE